MDQLSVNVRTLEFKEHNKNISVQNIFLVPLYTNTYIHIKFSEGCKCDAVIQLWHILSENLH